MATPELQLQGLRSPTGHSDGAAGNAGSELKPEKSPADEKVPGFDKNPDKLTLLPLIFLIYFEVAGGPYGAEQTVQAAGALYALLGFLIFPFIGGAPVSLVAAELSAAMPGNGGSVLWADRAFGPLCASLMGSWRFFSGAINRAAYPVLCADYLARVAPPFRGGAPHVCVVAGLNLLLSLLNYVGLAVVGYTSVALGVVSLAPFALMTAIAAPKVRPRRWLVRGRGNDWAMFFNTLLWNLSYWDSGSMMAGEVERPAATFPAALLAAGVMLSLGYLLPLMAGTGALDLPQAAWGSGSFADFAGMIGGEWLRIWIEVGAVLSSIGIYEAQLSSSAFQMLGMADLGLVPSIFASRAKWFGTPWLGILISSLVTLAISFFSSFSDIISSANFLYNLAMLMEFATFLWLRRKQPSLRRPYRVPVASLPGLVVLCLVPAGFLVFVMAISSWRVWAISGGLTALGIVVHYLMHVRGINIG